jgi:hypothetical protein
LISLTQNSADTLKNLIRAPLTISCVVVALNGVVRDTHAA